MTKVLIIGSGDIESFKAAAVELAKAGYSLEELEPELVKLGEQFSLSIEQLKKYTPKQIERSLGKTLPKSSVCARPVCFPGERLAKYKQRTRW